jgi:hemerythrin-like domain-containing protein
MADRCLQHLLQDHQEGERIVADIESLVQAQKQDRTWDAARRESFAQVVCFYEEVVLGHIQKEERVLFPALEGFLPHDMGPLAVLRGEHREIAANFRRLCEVGGMLALGRMDAPLQEEFERVAHATIQVTRDHIYKEDRVLFPMVARFLSTERDEFLLHEMQAMAAAPKEAAFEKAR